jgi:hypothetical protein|eukprot:7387144-Prymnesium_polylepis.1
MRPQDPQPWSHRYAFVLFRSCSASDAGCLDAAAAASRSSEQTVTEAGNDIWATTLLKLSDALVAMNEHASRSEMRAAASNAQMVQALELQHDQVATRLQEMNFRLESLANAMNRMEKSKRWI